MLRKSVLVVEDDPAILINAMSMFEDAGYLVVAFENADDALAYVYEHSDGVSAIFTDVQMPGHMDGRLLAEIVGRHWPAVTVMLTSRSAKPIGDQLENIRFVPKPWAEADVLAELEMALEMSAA